MRKFCLNDARNDWATNRHRPDFVLGHSINIGALVLCIITILCGIFYCKWENAKRDRGERDYLLNEGDQSLLGDRHPHFRYTI